MANEEELKKLKKEININNHLIEKNNKKIARNEKKIEKANKILKFMNKGGILFPFLISFTLCFLFFDLTPPNFSDKMLEYIINSIIIGFAGLGVIIGGAFIQKELFNWINLYKNSIIKDLNFKNQKKFALVKKYTNQIKNEQSKQSKQNAEKKEKRQGEQTVVNHKKTECFVTKVKTELKIQNENKNENSSVNMESKTIEQIMQEKINRQKQIDEVLEELNMIKKGCVRKFKENDKEK